jgi:hypothetical protein
MSAGVQVFQSTGAEWRPWRPIIVQFCSVDMTVDTGISSGGAA